MDRNIFTIMASLLIIAASANATVIDVVAYDVGESGGRLGGSTDPLEPNDTIGIKLVLRNNPDYPPGYPEYQGYTLCYADFALEVTGPGCLDVVKEGKIPQPVLGLHPDIMSYDWSGVDCNGIEYLELIPIADGITAAPDDVDIVWNLLLHCDANGPVQIDLTLHSPSEYNEYAGCDYPLPLTEPDLGDLEIQQGPPPWPDCWNWPGQCHCDNVGDDGIIDLGDFQEFKECFGYDYPHADYNPCCDCDRDGDVDLSDFLTFKNGFTAGTVPGDCTPGGIWPPE
jgi:hypothetical protein